MAPSPRTIAALALLACAAPAAAQSAVPRRTRTASPAPDAPPPTPTAATPAPAAAEEPSSLPSGPPASWFDDREWRVGSLLGFEFGTGDASYQAFKVGLEAETTFQTIAPRTTLGLVVSLGMTHASDSVSLPVPGGFGLPTNVSLKWSANAFELVPAARLTYAFAPKLWVYADGGLGLAYTASSAASITVAGYGTVQPRVGDGLAGVLRLAGGLVYSPTPDLRFGAQLLGFNVPLGDGLGSSFEILATASHRL